MKKLFSISSSMQAHGLAIIRIITGCMMIYHGWEIFNSTTMDGYLKWEMFDGPGGKTMVYLGKGVELLGGILMALGLFTRAGAVILLCTMGYIAFFVGHGKVWYEDQHPFLFVLLAGIYFLLGGGAWSLDQKLGGKD